ncbi:MAG: hypothetical protein LC637_00175 [Xanthomonadaceae bacterium]|nr:hypothetical protein [Xanthomonadaceae bacterium]
MKILSILIALLVNYRWPNLSRWRQYQWLLAPAANSARSGPDWRPTAVLIATSLIAGLAATALAHAVAGMFGLLIVGTATLWYTLGPRGLDTDIESVLEHEPGARQAALDRLMLTEASSPGLAASAAVHAALARWFGVIFWFVFLGPAGCLMYRAVREAVHCHQLPDTRRRFASHALGILNWPVMLVLIGALALVTDYDRVLDAFRRREDRWRFPVALIDDLCLELCASETDLGQGLRDGRQLAWRVLMLWLVVLSVLMLAGLLS